MSLKPTLDSLKLLDVGWGAIRPVSEGIFKKIRLVLSTHGGCS